MVWKKMVKVYNVKTEDHTCSKNNFYIGRGSPLGNPFGVKGKRVNYAKLTVPTREEAIEAYKLYFREMYGKDNELTKYFDEIYEHYKNGEDVYLQCFCTSAHQSSFSMHAKIKRCGFIPWQLSSIHHWIL